ncbi:tetratricopeptide repeat protein [Lentzea sp. NPDC005914]|uniref:tetratricopeptide repeat protein n=1 Tax=Lentzea sp. NPDC005914 TaxID=3154572 RepID=UPI0033CA8568
MLASADRAASDRAASGGAAKVLSGLGGVGKTQVAVRYAEQQWAKRALDLLVWVTATSKDAILTGYAETACQVLGVDEASPQRAAERLLAWLAATDKSWLIALDDLQDPGDVSGLWPPTTGSGQVLITTRRRDAALTRLARAVVDVDVFTPEESLAYLHDALTDHPHLKQGAAALAADLGHLPLALAHVVAYLIDRDLTCQDYRARLADRRRTLTDVFPAHGELPDDYRRTVAATWSLSIELANGLAPRGVARPLLAIASLLDPNGFPIDVFTRHPILDHVTSELGRPIETDDLRDALRCLHRLSLVTVDRAQPERAVRVHALVQRATRETLTDAALAGVARTAADALVDLWPTTESNIRLAQVLRSNTDALHANAGRHLWAPRGHSVLFRSGQSLGDSGLAADTVVYHQDLFIAADRYLGSDHQDTLAARREIARWRGEAGDLVGAAAAFPSLLADVVRCLGVDHPDTLNTRGHLGYWRRKAGDLAGAMSAYEELLVDNLRVLGPDHADTLSVRANLAQWQGEAGDPAGAAAAITVLLADFLRVVGPDDIATLWSRGNLAHWQGVAGDPVGARDSFELLLADHLRALGPNHPHTLRTRRRLAHWCGKAGDPVSAAAAYEELLADYLQILGPHYPDTISTQSDLAYWRDVADGVKPH